LKESLEIQTAIEKSSIEDLKRGPKVGQPYDMSNNSDVKLQNNLPVDGIKTDSTSDVISFKMITKV
jgi:hypothetical protein